MAKAKKAFSEHNHLALDFHFRTGKLAVDFSNQRDRPELAPLYTLLAGFGAQVNPMAKLWDKNPADPFAKVLTSGPGSASLKRWVRVTLPNEANVKNFLINLTAYPGFSEIIDMRTVELGIGSYGGGAIGRLRQTKPGEQPQFIPPVVPPKKAEFNIF